LSYNIADLISDVEVSPSQNLKIISNEVIFEVFQPVWKTYIAYLNVTQTDRLTDRLTDRQMDDLHTVAYGMCSA